MNLIETMKEEARQAEVEQRNDSRGTKLSRHKLFTEDEALTLVGTRLTRCGAIVEVKGYEYVGEQEEEKPYHGYLLYVRWENGRMERISKTDDVQIAEER